MDIRGVLENAASTVTGSVEKAKIRIKDDRERKTKKPTLNEMGKQKTGGLSSASALRSYTKGVTQMVTDVFSSVTGADGKYNRVMEVQFNPSSLRLSAMGGGEDVQCTNYRQNSGEITRGAIGLHVEMSVKLIFDQISNFSAFTNDMLTLSSSRVLSQATSAGIQAVSQLINGQTASVQMLVESFVATMRNENTRRVCFEWGEFYYEGILSRVNSTYTMFDLNGNPIRAEVTMVLYLVDTSMDKEYSEYWKDAYHDAFIAGNPVAEAMVALANKKKGLV